MSAIERLLATMSQLRDPEQGCSWDREQDYQTLIPHTIEEAYEVVDCVKRQDFIALPEELGDLLLQIVFYCQIAKERGEFDFDEVCEAINDKLIRRHPHIFIDTSLEDNSKMNLQRWEKIKQQEREKKRQLSLLDDIPLALPSLMRAEKIQKRCANVGFDWTTLAPVVDKIHEELAEVLVEAQQKSIDQLRVKEEIGDLMFAVVNLSRHLGVKAEEALYDANIKFERRFRQVETLIAEQGKTMQNSTLEEKELCWQQVKARE